MQRKKGFTLTELLVVIVIIGILSAVVLPKFNKMLEARKTTEAENIMTAVRSEQEARCSLDTEYATTTADLKSWPKNGSKNFSFSVTRSGITARNTEGDYALEMPSYRDGRICCSGDGCDTLNKNYMTCQALLSKIDYKPADESCTPGDLGGMDDPTWQEGVDPGTNPAGKDCPLEKPATEQKCKPAGYDIKCGNQTRTIWCDESTNYTWKYSTWSSCSPTSECDGGNTREPGSSCQDGDKRKVVCACGLESGERCVDGEWVRYDYGTCELTNEEKRTCKCEEKPEDATCEACGEKIEATCDGNTGSWNEPDMSSCKDISECAKCDDTHKEGETEKFDCECGQGEKTWHCGKDTDYTWISTITTDCVPKPATTEPCPAPSTGTVTISYICDAGVWRIANKNYDDCSSNTVDCTRLVENTTHYTNSQACRSHESRMIPCSKYGVGAGAYVSMSNAGFTCKTSSYCSQLEGNSSGYVSWVLSDGHTYSCTPGQITTIK